MLEVRGLVTAYPGPRRWLGLGPAGPPLRAVDGVSFDIARGEVLALVGESGCGKSSVARTILRLTPATAGEVRFDGTDVLALRGDGLRVLRRRLQVVFQDPYGSLNPRRTVGATVREGPEIHGLAAGADLDARTHGVLREVGLDPSLADRYPHELSGGQRQRVGIARALSVEPELLVCDEPVSALDVSVQAQVLNLLSELRERRSLTYLLIAHDLAVVRHMAHRVAVMYLGRLVELASAAELYAAPQHPYTTALLSAIPVPDPAASRRRIVLTGDVPSPVAPPPGCPFHPRCPHPRKDERCRREAPALREVAPGRLAACHYAETPW